MKVGKLCGLLPLLLPLLLEGGSLMTSAASLERSSWILVHASSTELEEGLASSSLLFLPSFDDATVVMDGTAQTSSASDVPHSISVTAALELMIVQTTK